MGEFEAKRIEVDAQLAEVRPYLQARDAQVAQIASYEAQIAEYKARLVEQEALERQTSNSPRTTHGWSRFCGTTIFITSSSLCRKDRPLMLQSGVCNTLTGANHASELPAPAGDGH